MSGRAVSSVVPRRFLGPGYRHTSARPPLKRPVPILVPVTDPDPDPLTIQPWPCSLTSNDAAFYGRIHVKRE